MKYRIVDGDATAMNVLTQEALNAEVAAFVAEVTAERANLRAVRATAKVKAEAAADAERLRARADAEWEMLGADPDEQTMMVARAHKDQIAQWMASSEGEHVNHTTLLAKRTKVRDLPEGHPLSPRNEAEVVALEEQITLHTDALPVIEGTIKILQARADALAAAEPDPEDVPVETNRTARRAKPTKRARSAP